MEADEGYRDRATRLGGWENAGGLSTASRPLTTHVAGGTRTCSPDAVRVQEVETELGGGGCAA